jgi:RNA polymerase sigma factor (sigma-70 family)
VQRYQRLVYAIVRRFGDDEHAAADVFQTVFSRLLQHLPKLDDPSRLQAWIVTTAKREALLQRKRAQRTVSMHRGGDGGDTGDASAGWSADWEPADEASGPERQLDELQQLHAVRQAMDRLDARCRDLLSLLFTDEDVRVPYEEVGRRLGLPVGSIGPTRARCLGKLRGLMA